MLIGGAMAYTFLRAQGQPTGKSLVEEDKIELAKQLLATLGDKLLLPVDHVVVAEIAAGAANEVVEHHSRRQDRGGHRAETIDAIRAVDRRRQDHHLERSDGHLREAAVRQGHRGAGQSCGRNPAPSAWSGGGDSEKAIKAAGVTDKISHVSTGGGASLEFLAGIELPGVAALNR